MGQPLQEPAEDLDGGLDRSSHFALTRLLPSYAPSPGHQIGPPAPNISLPAALSAIMLGAGGPKSRKPICVGGLMRQVQNIYIDWSGDGCVTNSDRALPPIDAWPP